MVTFSKHTRGDTMMGFAVNLSFSDDYSIADIASARTHLRDDDGRLIYEWETPDSITIEPDSGDTPDRVVMHAVIDTSEWVATGPRHRDDHGYCFDVEITLTNGYILTIAEGTIPVIQDQSYD